MFVVFLCAMQFGGNNPLPCGWDWTELGLGLESPSWGGTRKALYPPLGCWGCCSGLDFIPVDDTLVYEVQPHEVSARKSILAAGDGCHSVGYMS